MIRLGRRNLRAWNKRRIDCLSLICSISYYNTKSASLGFEEFQRERRRVCFAVNRKLFTASDLRRGHATENLKLMAYRRREESTNAARTAAMTSSLWRTNFARGTRLSAAALICRFNMQY